MDLESMVKEAEEKEQPKNNKKSHKRKIIEPEVVEPEIEIDEDMALQVVQMGVNIALSLGGLRQIDDIEEIAGARPFAVNVVGKYSKFFGKYMNEIMLAFAIVPVIAGRVKEKKMMKKEEKEKEEEKK